MSISEKEVKVSEPARLAATSPSPHRTITDKELTLVQICCDFVCTCIALPLSLLLLSHLSAVSVNAPGQLLTNMQIDSLFPVAVVIALASGGIYRVDPPQAPAQLVPRNPRALLRGGRGLCAHPRHRVPAPRPLRHFRAVRHPAGDGRHRHHRHHHGRPHHPPLLPAHVDDDPGPGGRGRARRPTASRSACARTPA